MYEVKSEIYTETDFKPVKCDNGRIISKFTFSYPAETKKGHTVDDDGDLEVTRKKKDCIEIEHSGSTTLKLVGLQVWRGALLLADFIFHNRNEFSNKCILELAAGVGLTSIASAIYCKNIICTDVDIGGILDVIRQNVKRNQSKLTGNIDVMELDFKNFQPTGTLAKRIQESDIVIAADVIYDDELTEAFINVLDNLLDNKASKCKTIYIALEKRYVFTIDELDTTAPCYEHFQRKISKKTWNIINIPIDFPQYFHYERCKELVLLKINNLLS